MKKNIFKTFVCGLAALALTSCANNWLDTEPSDGVDASTAITTDEELYSKLQDENTLISLFMNVLERLFKVQYKRKSFNILSVMLNNLE